jgi:uncharacterized protein
VSSVVVGGFAVAVAAFLGGVTGFGYAIVATPLLLVSGFTLPFVVTVNLALALVTRVTVVVRFRRVVDWRRAALLVGGSVPGLYLGAKTLHAVDPTPIKFGIGALVIVLAMLLAVRSATEPSRAIPGAPVAAGFAGGFLGTVTSLNGVPPVLLLTRDGVAPLVFIADLAVYFVASNAIGLTLLFATGTLSQHALYPTAVLWLPGALAANAAGIALAPRLPRQWFRRVTLAIVLVTGAATIVSAH